MDNYNYNEAVKSDVLDYIRDNIDFTDFEDLDELRDHLNDTLWAEDSVTGNGSGSYYCNAWRAEEAIAHNWDLLADAIAEFGGDVDILRQGPEACDVTIRCYVLGSAIDEALDEIEDDFDAAHEDDEDDDE